MLTVTAGKQDQKHNMADREAHSGWDFLRDSPKPSLLIFFNGEIRNFISPLTSQEPGMELLPTINLQWKKGKQGVQVILDQ